MKLRNKFILCFMAVVLVMVSLLYFYVNNTLSKRTMEEKAEDYSAFVQQLGYQPSPGHTGGGDQSLQSV